MKGLSSREAAERLSRAGPNVLPAEPALSAWRRFGRQLRGPLIMVLLGALIVDLGLWVYEGMPRWPVEATAITLILALNAALGFHQERRSEVALRRLESLAADRAWVLRDGRLARLPAAALVPGDLVRLEAGDRVPADGVLGEARGVRIDESLLTGESVAVDRHDSDEALSGTLLVRGTATLEVTRTGSASAMGRVAMLLRDVEAPEAPLARRVRHLGKQIARGVLLLAAALGALGVAAEGVGRATEMVLLAIALAVAAVPEGLPAVLNVVLSLGVERMARHRAVVRRLDAVEALGSVTVIATDKTGTLTEGRMEVRTLDTPDPARALAAIALANEGHPRSGAGDPLDLGLLRHAAACGIDVESLRRRHPAVSARPFDSAWKYSRVTVREAGRLVSSLKGAPEVLLRRCALPEAERAPWLEKADAYAREGFRVLAIAWREGETEEGLIPLGLVLLWDPRRPEVPGAVASALAAGIRVLMITGDHPATALAVAHAIGIRATRVLTGEDLAEYPPEALAAALSEVDVFARVLPEQKLQIVQRLQEQGQIVAMTGDGVNDAPALRRADVGVAMGQRGADVSREAADLVLLDDNFATIVRAVEEGRGIYENIQKFLRFLFSTNLSEVLLVAAGAVLAFVLDLRDPGGALVLPLTAAQILWINLLTDGIPALALAFDRTTGGVMRRPPRPSGTPLLDPPSWRFVLAVGGAQAALALGVLGLLPQLGYPAEVTRAAAFHVLTVGQILVAFPSRRAGLRPLPNPYLGAAVAIGLAAQVAAASVPWSAEMLGGAAIPAELWLVVLGCALSAWALAEGWAGILWRAPSRRAA